MILYGTGMRREPRGVRSRTVFLSETGNTHPMWIDYYASQLAWRRRVCRVYQRGLIHKDTKPAKVRVNDAGHAWLTGFGVAS
jgi:hypothetical protein